MTLSAEPVVSACPSELYVDRPRLHDLLDRAMLRPVTVVGAPAGSGKTTAVASWVDRGVHEATGGVWWLTVEETTDEPGPEPFWAPVLGLLRRHGGDARRSLHEAGELGPRALRATAAAAVRLSRPAVVVLDRFELAGPTVCEDLDFLLRHAGGRLHWVLLSRDEPRLPLARYRLEGLVAEVRLDDLAFTRAEAAELMANHGVQLCDASLARTVRRTGGWAAGLRFSAAELAGRRGALAAASWPGEALAEAGPAGVHGDLADYLRAEFLDRQRPDVRKVLLRGCVVDVLEPGLTEQLAGRTARRTLESLARCGAFVEQLPGEPGRFRYHPLLRDLLRAELAESAPARLVALSRRAAAWHATSRGLAGTGQLAAVGDLDGALVLAAREPAAGTRADVRLLDPLTPKELEVLGHLSDLLSTEEIAAAMFVSVNTVRTHVRSILRKLGVSRRNQAVRRGRDLRLITAS